MGLFSKKTPDEQVEQELVEEFRAVGDRLQDLLSKIEGKTEDLKITKAQEKLKKELIDKQIEWDREKEKWDREKRETEHMVGLQKSRMEQEQEMAIKEAQLGVREAHMDDKEEMFEQKMQNAVKPLEDAIDYLRTDIIKEILQRLPQYNVTDHRGGPSIQVEK